MVDGVQATDGADHDLAGKAGVLVEQARELASVECVDCQVGVGSDGGGAGDAGEHAELADEVAVAEGGDHPALAAHRGGAIDDDQELAPRLALAGQVPTGPNPHGGHEPLDGTQFGPREAGEEVEVGEGGWCGGSVRGHVALRVGRVLPRVWR